MRFALRSRLLALLVVPISIVANATLSTVAERSNFQKTGRYDEVIALCAAFQKSYPKAVRCTQFGRTPEGQAVATEAGLQFPPGLLLDGEPFSHGRLSENKLRRALEQGNTR